MARRKSSRKLYDYNRLRLKIKKLEKGENPEDNLSDKKKEGILAEIHTTIKAVENIQRVGNAVVKDTDEIDWFLEMLQLHANDYNLKPEVRIFGDLDVGIKADLKKKAKYAGLTVVV